MNLKCPRCGALEGFEVHIPITGLWVEWRTADGTVIESTTDYIRYAAEPKTMRCQKCGARVRNPKAGQPT